MPSWFLTFHQASDRYNCSPDPNKAIDPLIAMVLGQREHQAQFQCFGVHTCLFLWQEIDVYNPTEHASLCFLYTSPLYSTSANAHLIICMKIHVNMRHVTMVDLANTFDVSTGALAVNKCCENTPTPWDPDSEIAG